MLHDATPTITLTTRWSVVIVGYESQPGKRMDMVARTAKRNSDRGEATEQPRAKIQTIDLQPYDRFELLPIAGDWRHGRAESGLVDTNPHTDDVLLEIKQADRSDLDAAFAGVPRLRRSGLPQHRRRERTYFAGRQRSWKCAAAKSSIG
jgi:hypothetical protein